MLWRWHVNRQNIARNRNTIRGDAEAMATVDADVPPLPLSKLLPVFTVKSYKENRRGQSVVVRCKETGRVLVRGVYSPHKPLSCGAVLWLETDDKQVEIEVT